MTLQALSDKQIAAFQDSNSRINIFEGSVRAGKSFVSLLRFLEFIRSGPEGPLLIVGRTDKTIKRNIIQPLCDLVGSAVRYAMGRGEVTLFGKTIYVVGANDERSEAKIRGSEFAGALVDELSLIPESFIRMLLSRLSIDGAQLFATTNPDSPFHWIKREFIDRQHELNLSVFSFTIDDNPSLSEQYKTDLKKEYRGLWYQRFIEGKWVLAEGAVYDFYNESMHVIDHPPGEALEYYVGVDYGTTNPFAAVMIGYNPSCYPNLWCEKELYYDSKISQIQKSDYEYCEMLRDFIAGYNVNLIYLDPSAASLKRELQRQGISNTKDGVNDVLPGIRFQANLLSSGTYKICSQCVNTRKEYATYVWDPRASQRGEDKPVKAFDHSKDAERYVLYSQFFKKSGQKGMTEEEAAIMEKRWGPSKRFA